MSHDVEDFDTLDGWMMYWRKEQKLLGRHWFYVVPNYRGDGFGSRKGVIMFAAAFYC